MSDKARYTTQSRTVTIKGKKQTRYAIIDRNTEEIARGTKGYNGRNPDLYTSGEATSICRKMNKNNG